MRDLSSRHTGRRKSSSASHIGEFFRNNRFYPEVRFRVAVVPDSSGI